jgi:hypothetical protein
VPDSGRSTCSTFDTLDMLDTYFGNDDLDRAAHYGRQG